MREAATAGGGRVEERVEGVGVELERLRRLKGGGTEGEGCVTWEK